MGCQSQRGSMNKVFRKLGWGPDAKAPIHSLYLKVTPDNHYMMLLHREIGSLSVELGGNKR